MTDISPIIQKLLKKDTKKRRKFKVSTLFDEKFAKEGFQYVVHKKKKPRVAFLSCQHRKLLHERKGHDRMDCKMVTKPQNKLGPGSYQGVEKFNSAFSRVQNQIVSKDGFSSLISKSKRIQPIKVDDTPSPTKYTIEGQFQVKKVNQYPFNSATSRKIEEIQHGTDISGVCTYDTQWSDKDHSIPFEHSFGGRTKLIPVIRIKCTPENKDLCFFCNEKPIGDYWISIDRDGHTVCAECYDRKRLYQMKSVNPDKSKYQKIRDCSFVHSHEGTTAALPLMSQKDVLKQTIRECYFSTYMPTHIIKKKKPTSTLAKKKSKDVNVSCSDPDFLFKKMSKFIYNLYSKSEAQYLENRNITDQRVREILSPLSLVPSLETLMKHLVKEKEPYTPREFPIRAKHKKKFDIDKICEAWEWKYTEIDYSKDEVLKEQEIPDEIVQKIRKGNRLPPLMTTAEELLHQSPTEHRDKGSTFNINNYLWLYFKNNERDRDNSEEIPLLSEPLQYAISLIPTELKEYPIEKDKDNLRRLTIPEAIEEAPRVKHRWTELNLLQNPDIPPMPKPLGPGDEPMNRSMLDPDIASIFDDSNRISEDERTLSALTVGSQYGYPQLKP